MNKVFLRLMTIMMATTISVSFVSCDDDDDNGNNGVGNVSAQVFSTRKAVCD